MTGPVVVAGAILMFLPGGALAAGMRDLIDGAIVSGTARLFDALLLGAAVGIGVALALAPARALGAPVSLGIPPLSTSSVPVEVLAAALACVCFAVRTAEPRFALAGATFAGAAGIAVQRLLVRAGLDDLAATALAGVLIGAIARALALRYRSSATLWTATASLPLLPGLLLVEGLTNVLGGGPAELLRALAVGLALGIGCALGDIVVELVRGVNQAVVQPVVAPLAGLVEETVGRVGRPRPGDAPPPPARGPGDGGP
jgi:uncharacterized membrane protein YjjB (DUF3815 family)